jgi:hypothetical protein
VRWERRTTLVENSVDRELDEVEVLGKRLLFDPDSLSYLRGDGAGSRGKQPASNALADPDSPSALVRKLESSAVGCRWLLERWQELRAQLEPGNCWQSLDRLKIVQLLGRRLADARSNEFVAQVLVASHALDPVIEGPFHDVLDDMLSSRQDRARKKLKARWCALEQRADPADSRAFLIELVDQNIERISALIAEYEENAEEHAERAVERLGDDKTPEGHRLCEYWLKCKRALDLGVERFQKYQDKKKAERRALRIDDLRPLPEYRKPRIEVPRPPAEVITPVDDAPAGSSVMEAAPPEQLDPSVVSWPPSSTLAPQSKIQNPKSKMEDPPSSTLAPQSEIQNQINRLAGFREGEPPGEPLANPARTEPRPPKITKSHESKIDRGDSQPANRTTEANCDEKVVIIQNEAPVAVAANSGIDSALDKPDKPPCEANGGASADLLASSLGPAEIPRPHDAGGGDSDLTKSSGGDGRDHST